MISFNTNKYYFYSDVREKVPRLSTCYSRGFAMNLFFGTIAKSIF